ncbi:MAG: hypothetical protein LBK13_05620 [Spirochaetales bacterium]|jgi:hypothetical protein|nr:hypothetical protein [Spirochaetales bacterium]
MKRKWLVCKNKPAILRHGTKSGVSDLQKKQTAEINSLRRKQTSELDGVQQNNRSEVERLMPQFEKEIVETRNSSYLNG